MLLTPFVDIYVGWISTLCIIVLKYLMFDGSLELLMVDLLAGTIIVHRCRKFKFRKDILRAVLYGFALYAIASLAYMLLTKHFDLSQMEQPMAVVGINALVTLVTAFLLIPLLEKLFRFTLNLTFLNLTNYNHPLLRELQELAPGTYSHSLMVAVLAENAAHEIGASPTLCRCCSLYHDIGKTLKPAYFTENQQNGINPHKDYPPAMSAVVLKSHIKYGVELAQRFKLPQAIIDVIQQHHGTSLMQYFYKKALLLKKDDETVDEKLFRYDGPTPTFRESAIISLADALEAASRSLEEVTPESVEALISKIIHGRMEEEQLRDCPLTLKELDIVCKNFQTTLLNMYHSRVRYDKIEVGAMASMHLGSKPA
jgi:putative nucleotidyltransferase with HDIG domain